MTQSSLLELVKVLSPQERQEMASFLDSSFFNRGPNAQELVLLFRFILQASPDFSETRLQKDAAYAFVFPGQKNIPGKMEKLMTDLSKMLRQYAIIKPHLTKKEEEQQLEWTTWLRKRGLLDRSRHALKKLKEEKNEKKLESIEQFRFDLQKIEEEHEWESVTNLAKGDLKIPELLFQLDLYYFNYRFELKNRYLLQQKGAILPDFDTIEPTFETLEKSSTRLQISVRILQILQKEQPSVEQFQALMDLMKSKSNNLSHQTIIELNAYLRNICTILINNGDLSFIPILHQINKENLKQELFGANKEIFHYVYINLVQTAIRAKDLYWAKEFTEEYKNRIIGGDENQFYYRFNLTHCLFAEGNLEAALDVIPDAPSNNHVHHIIRRLEIKIYYELKSPLLEYKMEAFRKFVERTAPKIISPTLRKMDLNFFNVMNQITKVKKKSKTVSQRIADRINQKDLLSDRAWLLEKARELK